MIEIELEVDKPIIVITDKASSNHKIVYLGKN